MVERVARAMEERVAQPLGNIRSLEPVLAGSLGDAWKVLAEVAIEAMREPTEAMIDAADSKHDRCDGRTDMDEVWRDMINAALEKEKADGTSAAR